MKQIIANIRLPWLIFTLLVFISLVKLGLWQSTRAEEKQLRLDNIAQMTHQQAATLENVLAQPSEQINDLPIVLNGHFEPQSLFFLDNQVNKGRLGYQVFQVFTVTETIATAQQSLLVNLGWVLGSIDRDKLPAIAAITGNYTLQGHVRLVETGILLMEQHLAKNSWPLRVQQIELDKFSAVLEQALLPFVVYLDQTQSLGYEKNWRPIVMPPEKHRAYAFQWFSLAVAWLVLMSWALVKHSKTTTSV